MKHYLTQFRGFRIPGRKTLPINFTQRADNGVAVLAADFAILGAVTSVETWFAHAALPSSRPPIGQTVPDRPRQQSTTRCNIQSLPATRPQDSFPAVERRTSGVPGASRLMPSDVRAIRRSGNLRVVPMPILRNTPL